MATCGYLCPKCEGRGFADDGEPCDWCAPITPAIDVKKQEDQEEWIKSVHENPCCGDLGLAPKP